MAGAVYVSFTVEAGGVEGGFPERTAGVLNDTRVRRRRRRPLRAVPRRPARATATGSRSTRRRDPHHDPALLGREVVARGADRFPTSRSRSRSLDERRPPPPPDDASVAAGLRRVESYIRSRSLDQPKPGEAGQPAFVSREPNVFPPPVPPGDHALAAADAAYCMAPYVLGPDEALVITGRWPRVPLRERDALEPAPADATTTRTGTVSLNRAQTELEPDGSFEIVIAHAGSRASPTGSTPKADRSRWCSGASSSPRARSRPRRPTSSRSRRSPVRPVSMHGYVRA